MGLGVVQSWRFVHTSFSHRDARTLALLGRSQRPRQKDCRFLEHEVLDTMPLTRTLGKAIEDFLDDPCEKSEIYLWRFLRSLQGHVLCPSGPIRAFRDVINEWVEQFGNDLCTRGLLKWPACNRVSQALVSSRRIEVRCVHCLATARQRWTIYTRTRHAFIQVFEGVPKEPISPGYPLALRARS